MSELISLLMRRLNNMLMSNFFKEIINLTISVSPYLLIGFLFSGILSVMISQDDIERHLGRNQGFLGILKASLFSRNNFRESSIGKVLVYNDNIHINSKDGIVNCIKIQLENKKEMLAKDLLNGYKFDENSRVY